MKHYIYLVGIISIFFACTNRTAEKEEAFIRSRISRHNDFLENFIADSINRRNHIWDSIYHTGESQDKVELLTDSIIFLIYKEHNLSYNPHLDQQLSYTRFMEYCSYHKIDPLRLAAALKSD